MQYSFFDEEKRLKKITKLGDTLEQLNTIVNWDIFVPVLNTAIPRPTYEKGGRPPFSNLLMLKILIIKRMYNLSHDQTEYQINDRISFMRFLGLGMGDRIPDAKTIWLYEDLLSKSEAGQELFNMFFEEIRKAGYVTREGSIVDASFIEAPKRRNTEEQREKLKRVKFLRNGRILNILKSLCRGIPMPHGLKRAMRLILVIKIMSKLIRKAS